MNTETAIDLVAEQKWLDTAADAVAPAIEGAFKAGGEAGRKAKDILNGTWLGHPVHPILTDIPLGSWTTAAVFDVMEIATGKRSYRRGADVAITVGLVGALGAAVTGLTDWHDLQGRPKKVGMAHGILNGGATLLYATSLALRRGRKTRGVAKGLAFLGYAVTGLAAFLGGHLVYGEQIGVDHTAGDQYPEDFVPVISLDKLEENRPTRVDADGVPVVLVRHGGTIHALAEKCSHLGGPLAEGTVEGECIRCPWHGSLFSLRDGENIEGPSAYRQPCFEARVHEGKVEVRIAREEPA
jgi:nitrite reductase/ring-hydroxylating ferredoxin subunit/uncharacterized membrane protein